MLVMTTVAFFSNADELAVLKKSDNFNELRLIALTPEADYTAKRQALCYKTIEDYYNEADLSRVSSCLLHKVKELCDVMEQRFFSRKQFFSCHDIYMYIKIIYDQLLINHTFCMGINSQVSPNKIILFNKSHVQEDIFIEKNHDLLINCISLFFHKSCDIVNLNNVNTKLRITKNITGEAVFEKLRKLTSHLKAKYNFILSRMLNRKKTAILIFQAYDYASCFKLKEYYKVYWLHDINLKVDKAHGENQLIKLTNADILSLHASLTFDNVCYVGLIKSKVEYIINSVSHTFNKLAREIDCFISRKNIKAVISASGQSLENLAGIKAAKHRKIPVIWGQHGGFYGYAEFKILDYLKASYSHFFVYAKDISTVNNFKNTFVTSDSTLLDLYHEKRNLQR